MRCAQDRFHELVAHFDELYQRHRHAMNQTGQNYSALRTIRARLISA
jgi:hypothetical protein